MERQYRDWQSSWRLSTDSTQIMDHYHSTIGIDWGSTNHQISLIDAQGKLCGERSFPHGGQGLRDSTQWIKTATNSEPHQIGIAIEVPHGPVVETMMESGFKVHAINPKQLDRFRDRLSPAGANDDRRDARVLGDALRTDPQALHQLNPTSPQIIVLRDLSRTAEDLTSSKTQFTNKIKQHLWRYFPQFLELEPDLSKSWIRELWERISTPEKAQRIRVGTVAKLLARHKIRKISAEQILKILRQPAVTVAEGTVEGAMGAIKTAFKQLAVTMEELNATLLQLDETTEKLAASLQANDQTSSLKEGSPATDQTPALNQDIAILRSIPGVGRIVLGILLAEAFHLFEKRDRAALRCLTGIAPVTRSSGKQHFVVRRMAARPRLRDAMYHWARVAVQRDPVSKRKYAALRQRGHKHARALRSVADRLISVACAMLQNGSLYDPSLEQATSSNRSNG